MYSTEQKQKAIQAYLENNCNAAKTILQLGYQQWCLTLEKTNKQN